MNNENIEKKNILYDEDVKIDGKNYKFTLSEECIFIKKEKGIFNKKLVTVKSINIKDIENLLEDSKHSKLTIIEKNNEKRIRIFFNDSTISSKIKSDINNIRYASCDANDVIAFITWGVTFCIKYKKEIKALCKGITYIIKKRKKRKKDKSMEEVNQ